MKTLFFRFALYTIIIYLTGSTLYLAGASSQPSWGNGTHFCGVVDFQPRFDRSRTLPDGIGTGGTEDSQQPDKLHSDQYPNRRYARTSAANLNVGEPRTVRMIYFTPNDWQYRADIVQKMKDTIRTVQTFYAEQMEAHGYGRVTFRFETDPQGEPMVHRVDGRHPFSHYDNTLGTAVSYELEETYDFNANIYFIVLGTDALRQGDGQPAGGVGRRHTKNGGKFLVPNEFSWGTVAHELGHAFGLNHDFRDNSYVMSYGFLYDRLSACAADFLSVHSYFNPDTSIEAEGRPTIELISSRAYTPGRSVPVRVQVSDSDGLHQVELHSFQALQMCRRLTGEKDTIVEFEYDGGFSFYGYRGLSSSTAHRIGVKIVDTDGNLSATYFTLFEDSPYRIGALDGHSYKVSSVLFLHDNSTLASVGFSLEHGRITLLQRIKFWDVATRANIATLGDHITVGTTLVLSPDGATLASGDIQSFSLWDVETRQNIATLQFPNVVNYVNSVAFSPDGAILAIGTGSPPSWNTDHTVELWDVETRQNIVTLPHPNEVTSVAFSPDGTILAVGTQMDLALWAVETRQNIVTLARSFRVTSMAFSPDGAILAAGNYDGLALWDVEKQSNILSSQDGNGIGSMAFSPDGTILAAGTFAGELQLWDVEMLANFGAFGHPGPVTSVAFSPDGALLAAGTDWGTTIELWDMSMLMEIRLEALTGIDIPDTNLRAAIGHALDKPPDASISTVDIANLTSLQAPNANIRDLTRLEFATNLTTLYLYNNSISDISPLAGLANLKWLFLDNNSISNISPIAGLIGLEWLRLDNNSISDISPIAGLTNLPRLSLGNNSISDISPLVGLTNLTTLSLGNNSISNISPLAGLTNLTALILQTNNISNISPLAGLTNLRILYLDNNLISDISPLVANIGLGEGDIVQVGGNPLSYLSIHKHIPILQNGGVRVHFDNRAHPALLKISGDNQKGAAFASLSQPFVVEAQDENGSALAGVSVTFAVTVGGGTLTTTTTRTGNNGRAQSTLILGPNLGTNTVEVSAVGIKSPATFYAIADSELPATTADVNNDGSVNVLDLIMIASGLGQSGQNDADVNGDRVVNILDLILAAGMFEEAAAAPSAQPQVPETITAVEVQGWLTDARALEVKDPMVKRGFLVLEQLLAALTPTETELLANYPNPFNPETWIPYRLAEDAFVTLTIYDAMGQVVRTLEVGHRIAAAYENRSKAVYWDGRNDLGEQVASGVYFYYLSAGEYSATRRMVILK